MTDLVVVEKLAGWEKLEDARLNSISWLITKRVESEKQAQRRAVEWKADFQLDHIARYLEKEYEFDGGYAERRREAERLKPLIREGLIDELLEHPDMSYDEIQESIEDQVDERI